MSTLGVAELGFVEDGIPADVVTIASELAEATRRLKATAEEKERLARLLDTVLESIEAGVVLSGPQGEILAANAAAHALGAVVEDGETKRTRLIDALLDSREEHGLVRPAGEGGPVWDVRTSEVQLAPLGACALRLVQDVTRLVRLEEVARRRSSLEALGRMAAEVAHEVRNPLGSLELFATMLVDDLEARPDSQELAEQILVGVRQLAGTVTRLLSTLRGGRCQPAPLDAAAAAREALDFVRPVANSRSATLLGPLPEQSLPLVADPEGLRQSLLNLPGNAIDVVPEGGSVSLRVLRRRDEIHLEVGDSGPGIPLEERPRIFEAFYTTRAEGTGLGLAVVERFATAHDGRVEVGDSELGGALLTLVLPAGSAADGCEEDDE